MIDLQLLSLLVEVDRLGSVTAAAERLNVTQSALSHLVRRVEERHGVKVWTKAGRHLRLTQAGEHLLGLARRILPQIDDAVRVLDDFAQGRRGALRVGMECHPCQKWLAKLTPRYLAAWPDVAYDVRTSFSFDGVAALLGHEIDVLITPDPVIHPELQFTPVIDYELVLVVHETHVLASKAFARPQDLLDEDLVTVPVSPDRLDIYTRFLIPAHCRPRRHVTAEATDLMLQLVAAGRGITVLPDWLVREEGAELPIRPVRLGKRGIRKSINAGVRRGDEQTAYVHGFLTLAQSMGVRASSQEVIAHRTRMASAPATG